MIEKGKTSAMQEASDLKQEPVPEIRVSAEFTDREAEMVRSISKGDFGPITDIIPQATSTTNDLTKWFNRAIGIAEAGNLPLNSWGQIVMGLNMLRSFDFRRAHERGQLSPRRRLVFEQGLRNLEELWRKQINNAFK